MAALTANQAAWLEVRGVAGPFRALASGFRSDVLESASGFVIRLGRTPANGNTFSTEKRVMDAVRGQIDVAVPRPTLVEDRLPEFPHGVMVYPKLSGASPTSASRALAGSAASVLRQLHALQTHDPLPVRAVDAEGLAAFTRTTGPRLTEAQRKTVARWRADLERFLARNPTRCLVHGDFWHANWLASGDGRTLTGLVDFERAGSGLIQEDLAPPRYLGERFRIAVIDGYCDGTARDRALLLEQTRMFDVLRELRGLDWALRNPDAGELDDAVEKVAAVLAGYA